MIVNKRDNCLADTKSTQAFIHRYQQQQEEIFLDKLDSNFIQLFLLFFFVEYYLTKQQQSCRANRMIRILNCFQRNQNCFFCF